LIVVEVDLMGQTLTITRREETEPGFAAVENAPRVLLVGYNGACNTGAEALLLSDIADLRSVLGPEARITVPTLNESNLRRYLSESPTLRIAPIPTLYFASVDRLVREHDLVLLVEGSTYMDTWGSALLWAFLWATLRAAARGIPVLAYAVDAGSLSAFNRRLVRRVASRTDLIITRNAPAAERLRGYGVTAPIEVTADNAFNFHPNPADEGWVEREWPRAAAGLVGFSIVDFHLWPAVMRLWGRKDECYKWPYYFSRSPERRRASEALARGYARLADSVIEDLGRPVALICMEPVDEPLARRIHSLMAHGGEARLFCSRRYNASQMTVLLRSLNLLVTSRFHAGVLSLAARVPQIAVGHDFRLDSLYRDLGLRERFFVEAHSPWMFEEIRERIDALVADPYRQRNALARGHEALLARARNNRRLLSGFLQARGWGR
jgi:polysaccharide pyruvyl transferase WcaK-like protein